MNKYIFEIKNELEKLESQSLEELEIQIEKLKKRSKTEKLNNLIGPWFAMVQEISYRKIGLKHFDTQILAGLILHQGKIVEMKTGEGKTLASTLAVSLNALTGRGVHVVTVNEYLAERDKKWMGKIYNGLNLSVGLIENQNSAQEKRKNYAADITYVTNSELVFDYLRDNSTLNPRDLVQRPYNFCVLDEIDSILIDEARTPLVLSMPADDINYEKLATAKSIALRLQKNKDFDIDEKRKDINLTEQGYQSVQILLGKNSLFDPKDPWVLEILNALKAEYIFKLNKDYIILNKKIVIVDEFTGRVMEDRRWSSGIHEAIEIKEEVEVGSGNKTKSSITYQNFFTLYPKLSGMTGTAKTTEKEFDDIYNLEVVELPTSKPLMRKDLGDLIYQTELTKWKAVLKQSKQCFERGQPLLIGTSNVEKSEFLSDLFTVAKIPHQVLNAKPENVRRESEIVAQAGERCAVTIATNMAGRGTDIILGGNPYFTVKERLIELLLVKNNLATTTAEIKDLIEAVINEYQENNEFDLLEKNVLNLPYSFEDCSISLQKLYDILYKEIYEKWKNENKIVKELGGLFVLGTERHETRRIDNQLRGRSGRQGDPGTSQFFVSLEDDLIKIFGGDSIKRWVSFLIEDPDEALESEYLSKSLEKAQQKMELLNYDIRKNTFQYEEVLHIHRNAIFKIRKNFLKQTINYDVTVRYCESYLDELLERKPFKLNLDVFFGHYSNYLFNYRVNLNNKLAYKEIWLSNELELSEVMTYVSNPQEEIYKTKMLQTIDGLWTEHIERMNFIRETVNWRSYGQQNPLVEYNLQAYDSFRLLLVEIRTSMLYYDLTEI